MEEGRGQGRLLTEAAKKKPPREVPLPALLRRRRKLAALLGPRAVLCAIGR
jgi:hypothetical protein